ncbi:MAG TPA: histidine phosphatase family protein, partial [Rhodocyclaceae bacterium]|nr:histidine phosphatase family protein [Rhodocyclaceae bacterium]
MNAPVFHLPSSTRLCIVRHGETDWNAERRIQGQLDIPLNATGRQQAEAAARGLVD